MEILGLLLVYQAGWGGYAKFFEWISPLVVGVLMVLAGVGGLTGLGSKVRGGVEEGESVFSCAASLLPSATQRAIPSSLPHQDHLQIRLCCIDPLRPRLFAGGVESPSDAII